MKRALYISFIVISIVAMVVFSIDIISQVNQHVAVVHNNDIGISAYFSALFKRLISMMVFFVVVVIVVVILLLNSHKKVQSALELENINSELMKKQSDLEEQSAIIEELNSQLEDENTKYLQQKEILKAIIESLGAGIIMVDLDGKVVFINKAWKDLFHYLDYGDGLNPYDDFYINCDTCNDTQMFLRQTIHGIENGQNVLEELVGLIDDNERRYIADLEQISPVKRFINLYSNPCISGEKHSFGRVFVARDVSHQKEVDRLKMELISTVSHELRTPMSSILGFSELLLTRKLSEERNREYIGIINSEAKRLTNLINDFLDIQRMESGKQAFNKQFYSMDDIINESLKLFKNASKKHQVEYYNNAGNIPPFYCDRDKMLQVLSNLLSNAIKYSPEGGKVTINLEVKRGKVRIGVTDEGLGIPNDVQDKLFTKFFRIDNDDRREIGGTGLGLAICKEIIKAHGGDIEVQSALGQGSTFLISLPFPLDNDFNPVVREMYRETDISREDDVLIVEDDESMVKLIQDLLKDEGLAVHSVSSGEEALQLLKNNSYKLIILDIALSGRLNGWDVLKELKDNQGTASLPIIISSIYENKDIASQKGIDNYLVKPFETEQLIKMVKKALNGKLDSKMMVNSSNDKLEEVILDMLNNRGICVKQIEHLENILVITLNGK